jgi:hypothetical protein
LCESPVRCIVRFLSRFVIVAKWRRTIRKKLNSKKDLQ